MSEAAAGRLVAPAAPQLLRLQEGRWCDNEERRIFETQQSINKSRYNDMTDDCIDLTSGRNYVQVQENITKMIKNQKV
jgi:hypothetical protein